jgi:hypothetical protein
MRAAFRGCDRYKEQGLRMLAIQQQRTGDAEGNLGHSDELFDVSRRPNARARHS